jgi:dihydrolipoamide dehydrogenase
MVMGSLSQKTQVVVIGGGPGGYVAAIRAADLGKEVVLVEQRDQLGGVCLLEGCIPSKTLIHAVEVADAARHAQQMGLTFTDLQIDSTALRAWKDGVIDDLSKGIAGLLKRRGVEVVKGRGRFTSNHALALEGSDVAAIEFEQAIIATGSRVRPLPGVSNEGVWTSVEALALPTVPPRLLVVGGGYIGMELGLVYAGLGSKVTVVELLPSILITADKDLVDVVAKACKKKLEAIVLNAKVAGLKKTSAGFDVAIEREGKTEQHQFDQVLVSVGRRPNTDDLGLERTQIKPNAQGLIETNAECRSAEPSIFAIGDVTPGLALAHKASREGKVAAEVIAGHKAAFDNVTVPAVVFTDPEIAWTGLTELEAKEKGVAYTLGKFPLAALGRARAIGRTEGFAKVLADPSSGVLLGVGVVGPHASELIAGPTLALEMGATLEDLIATIHPHPTLSESIVEAAEVAAGAPIHINPPRKR